MLTWWWYTLNMRYALCHGDVLGQLAQFPENSFDAILTDPPYGIGSHQPSRKEIAAYLAGDDLATGGDFMGKDWSVPSITVWEELLRVLKPGAMAAVFGGARMFDLVTLGMRVAGFEIRDVVAWMYAKGYPKSLDAARVISMDRCELPGRHYMTQLPKESKRRPDDHVCPHHPDADPYVGKGTGLKPAWEPIVLARKPLVGTLRENLDAFGTGTLAIADTRIDTGIDLKRWPANVCMDEEAGAYLDELAGPRPSGKAVRRNGGGGQVFSGIGDRAYVEKPSLPDLGYLDGKTNASRFFFSTKVSTEERERGCHHLPKKSGGEMTERVDGDLGLGNPRAGAGRGEGAHNHHPTLKPISLAEWLAKMIKPGAADPALLIPYSGAGSEVAGALKAGWPMVVGIERDLEYIGIAHARVASWCPDAANDS